MLPGPACERPNQLAKGPRLLRRFLGRNDALQRFGHRWEGLPIATAAHEPRRHPEIAVSADLLAVSRCDPVAALRSLDCSDAGLDAAEAAERLKRFGPNQIARERRTGIVYELINRAKNPLNALLLTLAAISYFLSDARSAVVIAVMVVLSIGLAFIQEHRSNDAAAKLRDHGQDERQRPAPRRLEHPPTPRPPRRLRRDTASSSWSQATSCASPPAT